MNRREFIGSMATGLPFLASAGSAPNVLLFIVDQMRHPSLFPEPAPLPNYERLKARGVEFRNHVVCAAPCSPSRACLMTGRYMDENRVFRNLCAKQPSLSPEMVTLGHLFKALGYATPYFGKWHLTHEQVYRSRNYLEPYGFRWLEVERFESKFKTIWPGLLDEAYVEGAACWLQEHGHKKPWFLTVSIVNPHDIALYPESREPPVCPDRWFTSLAPNFDDPLTDKPSCHAEYQKATDKLKGKINSEAAWLRYLDYYYHWSLTADRHLGRILDTLAECGLDDSVVIFTSDHGDMCGSHRLRGKGPFVYLENIRVPLVISGPGLSGAISHLTQSVDLMPTLMDLLGLSPPADLPGFNLFTGAPAAKFRFTATNGYEKYMTAPTDINAVMTGPWIYAEYGGGVEKELYNLSLDPVQMVNLALDPFYQSDLEQLARLLHG